MPREVGLGNFVVNMLVGNRGWGNGRVSIEACPEFYSHGEGRGYSQTSI